jgi:hypothetical protein
MVPLQAAKVAQRREVQPPRKLAQRQLEIVVVDNHVNDGLADSKAHVGTLLGSPHPHGPNSTLLMLRCFSRTKSGKALKHARCPRWRSRDGRWRDCAASIAMARLPDLK